jgi:hypothetical protein
MRTKAQTNGTEPEHDETNVRGSALLKLGHALALSIQQRNTAPDLRDERDSSAILAGIRLVLEFARNEREHSHEKTEILIELFEAAMTLGESYPDPWSGLIRDEATNRFRVGSDDDRTPF